MLLAVVGAAALLGGCGFGSVATGETRNDTLSFDVGDSKSARVELRMGSGELRVGSGTPKLMEGTLRTTSPIGSRSSTSRQWDAREPEAFRSRIVRQQLRRHVTAGTSG